MARWKSGCLFGTGVVLRRLVRLTVVDNWWHSVYASKVTRLVWASLLVFNLQKVRQVIVVQVDLDWGAISFQFSSSVAILTSMSAYTKKQVSKHLTLSSNLLTAWNKVTTTSSWIFSLNSFTKSTLVFQKFSASWLAWLVLLAVGVRLKYCAACRQHWSSLLLRIAKMVFALFIDRVCPSWCRHILVLIMHKSCCIATAWRWNGSWIL